MRICSTVHGGYQRNRCVAAVESALYLLMWTRHVTDSCVEGSGSSGAASEMVRLMASISSWGPAFSMSRMMDCAVNMVERRRWISAAVCDHSRLASASRARSITTCSPCGSFPWRRSRSSPTVLEARGCDDAVPCRLFRPWLDLNSVRFSDANEPPFRQIPARNRAMSGESLPRSHPWRDRSVEAARRPGMPHGRCGLAQIATTRGIAYTTRE